MTLRSSQPTRDFIRLLNVGLDQSSQPCSMYDHNELDALRDQQVPGAAPRPAGQAHVQTRRVNSRSSRVGMVPTAHSHRISTALGMQSESHSGLSLPLRYSCRARFLGGDAETGSPRSLGQAAVPDIISAQAEVAQR